MILSQDYKKMKINYFRKRAALYKIPRFQRNVTSMRLNRDYFTLLNIVMILDQGVNGLLEIFYVGFVFVIWYYGICFSNGN